MKSLPFTLLIIVLTNVVVNAENDSFESCLSGKTNCSECYLALKKSLLGRDDNIRNLSLAFFPPQHAAPEFVTVTYNFDSVSTLQTWFWTQDSSYLFFPLRTFQYLSLFFWKTRKRCVPKGYIDFGRWVQYCRSPEYGASDTKGRWVRQCGIELSCNYCWTNILHATLLC